jgi:ribosome-binding factor A
MEGREGHGMAKKRVARLNEQFKRELTALLRSEVKDPRIGLITITDVEVTADLYHAKVYFTLAGDEEDRQQVLEGLRAATGFLRGELGRRMRIRRAPDLHFTFDNTLEHAMHIERLLREARAGSVSGEPGDAAPPENDDAAAVDGAAPVESDPDQGQGGGDAPDAGVDDRS